MQTVVKSLRKQQALSIRQSMSIDNVDFSRDLALLIGGKAS